MKNFAHDFVSFTSMTPVLGSQLNFRHLLYEKVTKKVTIHFNIPKTSKLSILAPYLQSYFMVEAVAETQNTSGFIFLFSFPVNKSNLHDKE